MMISGGYQSGPMPMPVSSYSSGPAPVAVHSSGYETSGAAAGSYKSKTLSLRASKTVTGEKDVKCPNEELRAILQEFMVAKDVEESKKNVHTAASELLPTQTVGVVCAHGAFSYRIPAKSYCEASKLDVTCFLYVQ